MAMSMRIFAIKKVARDTAKAEVFPFFPRAVCGKCAYDGKYGHRHDEPAHERHKGHRYGRLRVFLRGVGDIQHGIDAQPDLYRRRNIDLEFFLYENGHADENEFEDDKYRRAEQRKNVRLPRVERHQNIHRERYEQHARAYDIDDARRLFSEYFFQHLLFPH